MLNYNCTARGFHFRVRGRTTQDSRSHLVSQFASDVKPMLTKQKCALVSSAKLERVLVHVPEAGLLRLQGRENFHLTVFVTDA